MKRILAALGVTGLALLGATAPAGATENDDNDHKITFCHATGSDTNPYEEITLDLHALKAHHAGHGGDIIPASRKWDGRNWDHDGQAIYYNGCVPCPEPPVDHPEEPPVDHPEEPPVDHPEVPPAVTPEVPPAGNPEVPPAVTPEVPPAIVPEVPPAVVQPPAAAGAVVVNNPGFNVQTAAAASDPAMAPWAAGLIVMLLAAAGVAVRRVLPSGGTFRDRED